MWNAEYMLITLYKSTRVGKNYQADIPPLQDTLGHYEEKSKLVTNLEQMKRGLSKIQTIQPRQINSNPISFDEGPFYDRLYVYTCEDTNSDVCKVNAVKVPVSVQDIGDEINNDTLESFGYLIVHVNDSRKFVHIRFFKNKEYKIITDRRQIHDPKLLYILILKRKNASVTLYIIYRTWSILVYSKKYLVSIHPFFKRFLDARLITIPGLDIMGNDVDTPMTID